LNPYIKENTTIGVSPWNSLNFTNSYIYYNFSISIISTIATINNNDINH